MTRTDIFGPYNNGKADVYGDPLAIHRRLVHHLGGDPNQFLKDYRSEVEPVAFEATQRLLAATTSAFGLFPFDPMTGEGATEDDTLNVLFDLVDWLESKKKSTGNSLTSSPATGSVLHP